MRESILRRVARVWLRLGDRIAQMQLLSFLPLCIVIAWWSGQQAVLFVVSFMFPMLLALQELARPDPAADGRADAAPPAGMTDPAAAEALPGRTAALARLGTLLDGAHDTGHVTALLLLDIDGFRHVNLRHGPEVGDAALQALAGRLREALRVEDLLVRTCGDRFAVVLAPLHRLEFAAALALAERLCAATARPIQAAGATLRLGASVGICMMGRAPEEGAAAMFAAAEAALAEAKAAGPGSIRSFTPRMRRATLRLRELAAEIDSALADGQIRPWFQPQIRLDTGEVTGFEALARWEHPEQGVLAPVEFLPAVAVAGAANRLGEVILSHALAALGSWARAGHAIPAVGVNFSTGELRDPGLCERLKWEIDRFDLAPSRLVVEVTETLFGQGADPRVSENIRGLAGFGFGIDLDDFGSGHAAVANLCRYGVRRIKLDRALIAGIDAGPDRQRLVMAILRMAEGLGIETIAEGVETEAEREALARAGCRHAQGCAVAPPMPFDETLAWLTRHAAETAGGTASGLSQA